MSAIIFASFPASSQSSSCGVSPSSDWDIGENAHKKAQADLQILRYTKTDMTFNDLNMKWHVESGPPTNRSHPTARWTRVLCGFMVLSPPKFYSGGAHQIGENNVSLTPGDIHFYLPGAPTKVYPLYKGELWVVLWKLWMPSAFDSTALQGYRATLVEPALYHLVDDGALYLAPHAISEVVDETGKEIAASELVDALAAWCTRPEYVHAHAWEPGDYVRTGADQISLRLLDGAELPRHRRDDGS